MEPGASFGLEGFMILPIDPNLPLDTDGPCTPIQTMRAMLAFRPIIDPFRSM